MNDDHAKRFKLSLNQPQRPFNHSAGQGPPIKTKDNAQPVIPPPRTVFRPHPYLAPPGMMGARLAHDAATFIEKKREDRANEPTFKPLVTGRDKSRGWER